MNLEFIDKFNNFSGQQLQQAYDSALYLAVATSAYYILFGGVMSISNMIGQILKQTFSNLLFKPGEQSRTKITLISGLVFFSALMKTLYHQHISSFEPFDSPKYTQNTSALRLIIAGLLVGFGSQYAVKDSNNTFGLDGIPCFNIKSVIGHLFALIAGCLTQTYQLHTYLPQTPRIIDINLPQNITYQAYLLVFIIIPFMCFVISSKKSLKTLIAYMSLFSIGIIFAYGLMLGGFTQRKIVYNYLTLDKRWNPSMIIMYGYGIGVSAVVYIVMRYILKKPVFGSHVIRDQTPIRINLLIGSIIFGMGWGIGGLKPASVLVLMPLESIKIIFYWGLSCLIGMKTSHKLFGPKIEQAAVGQKTQKSE